MNRFSAPRRPGVSRPRHVVLALALLVPLLLQAPSVAAQPTQSALASAATVQAPVAAKVLGASAARSRDPLTKWKCGSWKHGQTQSVRWCAKLKSIKDKVKIDYRERFYNDSKRRGTVTCEHTETTTWTFGASVTGEVEAGVIFSKVKASATASVSRASSTSKKAGVSFPHPPKSYVYCERGIHGFSFTGTIRRQLCGGTNCIYDSVRDFKGSGPEAGYWRYGDGRGGIEVRP